MPSFLPHKPAQNAQAMIEVRDQVDRVFEADMEAHDRAAEVAGVGGSGEEAGCGQDEAGAELVIGTLDDADGAPSVVHDAEPDGVAAAARLGR